MLRFLGSMLLAFTEVVSHSWIAASDPNLTGVLIAAVVTLVGLLPEISRAIDRLMAGWGDASSAPASASV